MPSLAVDTATDVCAIALGQEGRLLDESAIEAGRSHLEMLLPEVHRLLSGQGLGLDDIDAFVAGTGPGTFTGLRVGISTARGLSQALQKPLFGFSTLRALALAMAAERKQEDSMDLLPIIDAKRGQVFAQLFTVSKTGRTDESSDILCLSPQELVMRLPRLHDGPVLAAGNGVLAYLDRFGSASGIEIIEESDPRHRVSAAYHLSAVKEGVYEAGSEQQVLPVYVREPDADKTVLLRKREPWLK